MFKKTIGILVLCFLYFTVAFAQSETHWEYLEVSPTTYIVSNFTSKSNLQVRNYNYLNEGKSILGEPTFERIGKEGWELITAYSNKENQTYYVFKRKYIKVRTDIEIEKLEKWVNQQIAEIQQIKASNLTDLDIVKEKQELVAFNQRQKERLKNILDQVKDIPIQIVSIEADSTQIGKTSVRAALVVDATDKLLKTDNNYRYSEANEYLKEVFRKIANTSQLELYASANSNAKAVSTGNVLPEKIDYIGFNYGGLTLKVSIVVNYNGQQNIVAQRTISGVNWDEKQNK